MAALTDYTSYDEVRATLGVNSDDLEDATIALEVYVRGLVVELEEIGEDVPEDFATVKAKAENERTSAEQRFYDALKLFAPYCVGNQLASGVAMFAPKSVTDGKAATSRDSTAPYKYSVDECRARYSRYLLLLRDRYADYKSTTATVTARPYFSAVSPATDPVTGS